MGLLEAVRRDQAIWSERRDDIDNCQCSVYLWCSRSLAPLDEEAIKAASHCPRQSLKLGFTPTNAANVGNWKGDLANAPVPVAEGLRCREHGSILIGRDDIDHLHGGPAHSVTKMGMVRS